MVVVAVVVVVAMTGDWTWLGIVAVVVVVVVVMVGDWMLARHSGGGDGGESNGINLNLMELQEVLTNMREPIPLNHVA